jgi:hypothetical protein
VGRLAGGVGLSVGVIARAEWAEGGPRGGKSRARGESGRGCGPGIGPARGEKGFSFFQFLFFISIFISFSFEQLIN